MDGFDAQIELQETGHPFRASSTCREREEIVVVHCGAAYAVPVFCDCEFAGLFVEYPAKCIGYWVGSESTSPCKV
jgi:hypothetical protein